MLWDNSSKRLIKDIIHSILSWGNAGVNWTINEVEEIHFGEALRGHRLRE